MTRTTCAGAMLCCLSMVGCSFHARDADSYRKVTRQLLETKQTEIQSCYDGELKKDPKVAGTVVLKFTVKKDTGKVTDPTVDPSSTAPATLSNCVVQAISGLTLDPPDARDGDATFRWEFQAKS